MQNRLTPLTVLATAAGTTYLFNLFGLIMNLISVSSMRVSSAGGAVSAASWVMRVVEGSNPANGWGRALRYVNADEYTVCGIILSLA